MPLQYPLCAVVGSDDMTLALILTTISPEVGGVLVRGEKGTAKSTTVRALASVLPPIEVVAGDRFSSAPGDTSPDGAWPRDAETETRPVRLVELPVGATEDRVLGSLHLSKVLADGVAEYEPGLLARAHRGILYVDEVNLLHDHLVDLLLDAAAMGRSTVERDGVSVAHAARFVLVGTMNPEEGELRPQLLDRFGLTVEIAAPRDPQLRAEVVRRRLAFDADPEAFVQSYADAERALTDRIAAARKLLPEVELTDAVLTKVAEVCAAFEVDGMRADIVTTRTAIAHAAWHGRTTVTRADIRQAALLALPHRRRRNPFDAPGLDEELLDAVLGDEEPEPEPPMPPEPEGDDGRSYGRGRRWPRRYDVRERTRTCRRSGSPERPDRNTSEDALDGESPQTHRPAAAHGRVSSGPPTPTRSGASRSPAPARASRASGPRADDQRPARRGGPDRAPAGCTWSRRSVPPRRTSAHAAGPAGGSASSRPTSAPPAARDARPTSSSSASTPPGSMAARKRMEQVKTAILSLLLDAYQRRDKVGLVTFRADAAEVALPPTHSVDIAARAPGRPARGRAYAARRGPARPRPRCCASRRSATRAGARCSSCHRRPRHPRRRTRSPAAARPRSGSPSTGITSVVVDCEQRPDADGPRRPARPAPCRRPTSRSPTSAPRRSPAWPRAA